MSTERDEDEMYRRVYETQGSHARMCIEIARDGIPRRHVEAMVARAAARESWRIAGMSPPTPGARIWTYTGKARDHAGWRGVIYDAEGEPHPLSPDQVRTYIHDAIDERRGIEARRPSGHEPARMTTDQGADESTAEWTPSDPLIVAQASKSGIRRCAICRKPIPSQMRADAKVCSAKHRRLLHRLQQGDETVHEAIRMETNPPPCLGCGKPLFGKRAGTKVHNDYCRRLARERLPADGATKDIGDEISTGEWTPRSGVSAA